MVLIHFMAQVYGDHSGDRDAGDPGDLAGAECTVLGLEWVEDSGATDGAWDSECMDLVVTRSFTEVAGITHTTIMETDTTVLDKT